jgi:betaine reductase
MAGPNNLAYIPVVKGASYFLGHVPGLVRYGSKPSRDVAVDPTLVPQLLGHLWTFDQAVSYPPNQAFIGNIDPDELRRLPGPFHLNPLLNVSRFGPFGEIMPEDEFYGMVKRCDEFDLVHLEERFVASILPKFASHPLINDEDVQKLGEGAPLTRIEELLSDKRRLPLFLRDGTLIGCVVEGHDEDTSLAPDILLENLTSRAAGVLALRRLISATAGGSARSIDYLLGCGEEAIGDRYNRGGGNLAKAIGELCGCDRATGADVKAFCCGPVHALVLGAGLVASGLFETVVLVAGGSLAKLGMKFHGHLRHDMPILEDVLAGMAVWITRDDGKHPIIRLDSIGKHEISSGSAQQAILNKLVVEPLDRLGLKLTDVDKYATEMHNPEITEPQGSGNVPKTNYRMIASFAVIRKEIARDDLESFVERHGVPGFSPTQGHIASAVPLLAHAVREMEAGRMERMMFLAKGSLFLGRMTHLSDGISFLLERNRGRGV